MNLDEYNTIAAELNAMGEEERAMLDPICKAISDFHKATDNKGWRLLCNRVIALKAVKELRSWEREYAEMD